MSKVNPIPKGYHTVTAGLTVSDAKAAIEFYKNGFGAEEVSICLSPEGKVMHAEIRIGDSLVMLCDEFPQWGCLGPKSLGGTAVSMYIYIENVDEAFERAVKAGGTATMPVSDTFWGDRMGQITDPFGHKWSLSSRVADLTMEQIEKAKDEWLKKQMACAK